MMKGPRTAASLCVGCATRRESCAPAAFFVRSIQDRSGATLEYQEEGRQRPADVSRWSRSKPIVSSWVATRPEPLHSSYPIGVDIHAFVFRWIPWVRREWNSWIPWDG